MSRYVIKCKSLSSLEIESDVPEKNKAGTQRRGVGASKAK